MAGVPGMNNSAHHRPSRQSGRPFVVTVTYAPPGPKAEEAKRRFLALTWDMAVKAAYSELAAEELAQREAAGA